MNRPALVTIILCAFVATAAGAQKFTPKLPPGYELPRTATPAPPSSILEGVDILVLAIALAAASYLAIKRRSRRGLLVLMLLSLGYFGFYRGGCICPIGAIQNIAAALFDSDFHLPFFVSLMFLLPLVFTLLFGRTFCASVCPLGAMQDLVGFWPVSLPRWLTDSLGLLAWAYLAFAVLFAALGSGFIICRYDPFVAFFRLSGNLNMLVLGACVLLVGMFIARPYCRFLCPLGAILRPLSAVSKWHVTITPGECINCRLCEDSCPYDAIDKPNAGDPPPRRSQGRKRLAIILALLPALICAGVYMGWLLGPTLSRTHRDVRLAERIRREKADPSLQPTDASDAFYRSSVTVEKVYARAGVIRGRFLRGGAAVGGFLALVVWLKLLSLGVRRTREDYTPNPATCMSCGRCFKYCPIERQLVEKGEMPVVKK